MLTADEIEDGQDVEFRQRLEDLDDGILARLLDDEAALRERLPPALPVADAQAMIRELLAGRTADTADRPAGFLARLLAMFRH